MKLVYLLQTVKGVPLDYDFRLYTYGPFESDVLDDLGQAQSMRAVESKIVDYPSGSGYVFGSGPESGRVKDMCRSELSKYEDAISWVISEFGSQSTANLELLSTIIYTDRDALERGNPVTFDDLCRQVREIKPRFTEEFVRQQVASLADKNLLISTERDVRPMHC
jgi:uncharacterized protein YwgA